ncbi:MAG: FtsX-like permease family protein [Chloroflexaceae bacterium]
MGNFFLTLLSVLTTAFKRLRANLWLSLCALIALITAVALCVSIPVYAEGASLRLLQGEITRQEQQMGRSPFSLLFRYVGSWEGPLEWERVAPADAFITGPGLERLGLPLNGLARHARTEQVRLFLPPSAGTQNQFLKNVTLGFITGLEAQMQVVAGTAPQPATDLDDPIEVMVMRSLADEIGMNVGDQFTLVTNSGGRTVSLPLVIAGLWEPVNPLDPAWFFQPDAFRDVLLVPEATFTGPVADALRNEVGQVLWFARLNDAGLTAAEASPLLRRIESVRAQAAGIVPGLRLEQSPAEALDSYQSGVATLVVQLFVFSAPILALVLYFVSLVANLLVSRQRGEIALLKTRGVRDTQILGIYIVEWLIMGLLALLVGPGIGLGFARFMSRTGSFLQLTSELPTLPLTLTWENVRFGGIAVVLALVSALLPALFASRHTLVDEQQQAARTLRPPFWQRFYLDIALLLPPAYGLYQLRQGGGLQLGAAQGADPFTNPLLLIVPVLLCFGLGLFAVRIIPLLLSLATRLAVIPNWTGPLVALRSLARQPGSYRGPLLLLILTLSLAAYSASMARTLDGSLRQAIRYQVGADTQLIETGQSTEDSQGGTGAGEQSQQPERKNIEEEARFLFVPVDDHLEVTGITAVARVGSYDATIQLGGINTQAQLVGIDRIDFPQVITNFDPAWGGGQPLGALMNLLARTPEGVLVSRDMLAKGLEVGDVLPAQLSLFGDRREVQFVIVAAIDLWPGFYPQDGPIVVANLDYIFDQMRGQYPYDAWIARSADVPVTDIASGVRRRGINLVDVRDAATLLQEAQAHPRRQGLFGLLSVGFIAAGVLTLLGFLLAALITARRRAIELGVLRALGMAGSQVAVSLVIEHLVLVAAGIGAGTGIGLLVAWLVVPVLQVGAGPQPGTPPYPPEIAWNEVTLIYVVFAVALLLTLLALAWVLGRMQLFQAVKLGDVN